MSTYWYFACTAHDPQVRSEDEFTQHTDDAAFRHAIDLALSRPIPEDWYDRSFGGDSYFERHALRFLAQHPACPLILVNEYGDTRPLEGDDPPSCRCMNSLAYVSPTHPGHCCFLPADTTCHPEEFAAWEARRDAARVGRRG